MSERLTRPRWNLGLEDDISQKILSPLTSIRGTESKWVIEFDLPLVDKKDIKVSIDTNNLISVEAELKETYCDEMLGCKNEFQYYKKQISLPSDIDKKSITSKFSDGILTIQVPRKIKGTKIKVE